MLGLMSQLVASFGGLSSSSSEWIGARRRRESMYWLVGVDGFLGDCEREVLGESGKAVLVLVCLRALK